MAAYGHGGSLVRETVVTDPGRAYDRGLLLSTFGIRIHNRDDDGHACGVDDTEAYLGERSENSGFR